MRVPHKSGVRPSGLPPGFGPAWRDNTKNAGSKAGGSPKGPAPQERPSLRPHTIGFRPFCQWIALASIFISHTRRLPRLAELAARYADRKPDLADLCLIRLSELHPRYPVITTDLAGFRVYRRGRPDE